MSVPTLQSTIAATIPTTTPATIPSALAVGTAPALLADADVVGPDVELDPVGEVEVLVVG